MVKSSAPLVFDLASWTKRIPESAIRKLLRFKVKYYFAGGKPGVLPLDVFSKILVEKGLDDLMNLIDGEERKVIDEFNYGPSSGVDSFRETLSGFLRRSDNLKFTKENILVTTGSQQVIYGLLDTMIDPGDVVLSSNPTYLGFMNVAEKLGAKVVTLPTDENGMVTDYLDECYRKSEKKLGKKPELIYVIPDSDNPTGTTLPWKRRKEIYDFAAENKLLVIEDAAYREIQFKEKIPPIKSLDEQNLFVAYIRTSSKEAAPLRVAYSVLPLNLMREVVKARGYYDLCTSTLTQKLLEIYYSKYIDKVLPGIVKKYEERCRVMAKSIDEFFPNGERSSPRGGFFFWWRSTRKFDATLFVEKEAIPSNVAYVPGEAFFTVYGHFFNPDTRELERTAPRKNTMRLSFSYLPPQDIERGIEVLGKVLKEKMAEYHI